MLKKIKNRIERYFKNKRMRNATKVFQKNKKLDDGIYWFKK